MDNIRGFIQNQTKTIFQGKLINFFRIKNNGICVKFKIDKRLSSEFKVNKV
jgi:hypothetical protein